MLLVVLCPRARTRETEIEVRGKCRERGVVPVIRSEEA